MSRTEHKVYLVLAVLTLALSPWLGAQNNVGIGTRNPHPTALLEVADSNRGFLLPRTDTMSIHNYVNSLSPNPGIAHGLTIFEVNKRAIYIYNGLKMKWEPVSSLVGPMGPTGITGPTGPRGDRGIATQWRDSAITPPIKRWPAPNAIPPYYEQLGDTCGDFYHQTATGLIWTYDCAIHDWKGPIARWRSLGHPKVVKLQAFGLLEEAMPASAAGNILKQLGNLTYQIKVPPDTVAHVWITAQGNVQKKYTNYHDINRMVFDFYMIDTNGVGKYLNRQAHVTIAPSHQIPLTTTSQFDKVQWEISMAMSLEGKISPAGNPLPVTDFLNWTFQTHYGQFFQAGNTIHTDSSRVIVLDNAGSASNQFENFAMMNIYIVFIRSRNAAYPY